MTSPRLREIIEESRNARNVPGVSAAIFVDGEVSIAAAGLANVSTGVAMTPTTLAHVGSITKVINATLVMQLVDAGVVALERPITDYLPAFRVADSDAARDITVEMLLNHTSGLGANLLPDAGHDNETIAKTVSRIAGVPQVHDPGEARSYCNAGTVVAGHLCQHLTSEGWHDLVKTRIFGPLGLEHAAVLPEDALLHSASVGHFLTPPASGPVRTSTMFLPLGYAPAGSTNMMSALDLLTFARAHMDDGSGPGAVRVLSKESAVRMRGRSGDPESQAFDSGIGWRRVNGLVTHGGGGPGIVSYVCAHVESKTAAVVLTNAEHGLEVLIDVLAPFVKERLGIEVLPALPDATPDLAIDPTRYVGTYENNTVSHDVTMREGRLYWSASLKHQYYDSSRLDATSGVVLVPAGEDKFLVRVGEEALGHEQTELMWFTGRDAAGRKKFLVQQLWMFRRTTAT
jgi:CubicO group peptidase (beta-lactamase class C family)